MRHGKYGRTLGRHTNHQIALRRNLAIALFTHGQITTTIPKAKSVKPFVERIISAAKQGDLASRRRVIKMLGRDQIMMQDEEAEGVDRNMYGEIRSRGGRRQAPRVVKHLFEEIAPRYTDRDGGYTRIIRLARHRIGDGSDLCVLQLVGDEEGPQVSGDYSRRREKANRRMEFAAKLRKGGKAEAAEADAAPVAEDAAATAVAEPEAEAPAEETAAEAEATPAADDDKKDA
ncbi:MAG: 50S ribosomal protein L17 [Planctomycetes bacterium]|jgi:large subunit ribosomal protein L17|nr:50S ribosomal protein L17 [Planctomycetota bacterium]